MAKKKNLRKRVKALEKQLEEVEKRLEKAEKQARPIYLPPYPIEWKDKWEFEPITWTDNKTTPIQN